MTWRIGTLSVSRRYCVGAVVGAALLLAACAATPPAPPRAAPLRDPAALMGGTTRFDPARFAGEWHVVAAFGAERDARRYVYDPAQTLMREEAGESRIYRVTGPGILSQVQPEADEKLVVMWVDEGFRTAALGTPEGARGVILNRTPDAAPDRLAAAIEILDFNGWDTSRLQRVK